jgi:hypothetical protein
MIFDLDKLTGGEIPKADLPFIITYLTPTIMNLLFNVVDLQDLILNLLP